MNLLPVESQDIIYEYDVYGPDNRPSFGRIRIPKLDARRRSQTQI